jgi:hypothetical protein
MAGVAAVLVGVAGSFFVTPPVLPEAELFAVLTTDGPVPNDEVMP